MGRPENDSEMGRLQARDFTGPIRLHQTPLLVDVHAFKISSCLVSLCVICKILVVFVGSSWSEPPKSFMQVHGPAKSFTLLYIACLASHGVALHITQSSDV